MRHTAIFDFTARETGRPMRAVYRPTQPDEVGRNEPSVAFYDRTYDFTEHGQFTGASYYVSTFLDDQRSHATGLALQGAEPAWNLSAFDVRGVKAWLNGLLGPRAYVVGLPVTVTVHPDGGVVLAVDTSEVERSVERDAEHDYEPAEVLADLAKIRLAIDTDNLTIEGL